MRLAPMLIAIAACAHPPPTPHVEYPTLEPDGRIGAVPLDPYGPDPVLHGVVGEHLPSDVDLGDPGAVTAMVVRLQTGSYRLPSTPTHKVTLEADQVQRVAIGTGPGALVTEGDRAAASRATATIDAKDPAIRRAARDATSGARTDRQRVDGLVTYVYTHVHYVLSDETVASTVLSKGTGDCSEMSLLFVALARAAGIPARRVVGLAATRVAGASAFGFHAWAEVALGGHWVAVDPTWNEPVADATHVMLLEGDGSTWGQAVDHLALAVVEVKRDASLVGRADVRQLTRELPSYLELHRH